MFLGQYANRLSRVLCILMVIYLYILYESCIRIHLGILAKILILTCAGVV